MAAGAIEALAKVLEPLGLGCIETQETKTRRRRLTMLQCGRRYQRQKKTFGFSSGTEEVTVRVDEDATSLLWWASGADKKHIDLKDGAFCGDPRPARAAEPPPPSCPRRRETPPRLANSIYTPHHRFMASARGENEGGARRDNNIVEWGPASGADVRRS
mmetsp:Transcript_72922/g.207766  ORF Transcript_72922/g.207766 Transcript_72922/m.207766 type:complete len:159 (+) Transcript_72922:189-665(+)